MSEERKVYGVTVRLGIMAASPDEAGYEAARLVASGIAGGMQILPLCSINVEPTAPDKSEPEPESPKAEDVFGRIMSAPDVQ
jgi:hypothetical protein